MKLYTLEKNTMKAVRTILKASEKRNGGGVRTWATHAYLYGSGLMLTDGQRLLRVRDQGLEEEFADFIRETGRVVVLDLTDDALAMSCDMDRNDTEVGTMEKLIPSDERFSEAGSKAFVSRLNEGKEPKVKDISGAMLNMAILSTGRWFNPELFDGMGVRPWSRVLAMGSMAAFHGDSGETFVCMGMGPEAQS